MNIYWIAVQKLYHWGKENYFSNTIQRILSLTTRWSYSFSRRSGFISSRGCFHVSSGYHSSCLKTLKPLICHLVFPWYNSIDHFLAKWNSSSNTDGAIYCKIPLNENWNIMVSESTEKDSTMYLEKGEKSRTCIWIARQHDHNCWQQEYYHRSYRYFYRNS